MAGHFKHFMMNINNLLKSGKDFRRLNKEELFETSGGRILPIGVGSAYIFMSSLLRDLLKKKDE